MLRIMSIIDCWNIELQVVENAKTKRFERFFFDDNSLCFKELYPTKEECAELAQKCIDVYREKMKKLKFPIIDYKCVAIEIKIEAPQDKKSEDGADFIVIMPPEYYKHVVIYDVVFDQISVDGTVQN